MRIFFTGDCAFFISTSDTTAATAPISPPIAPPIIGKMEHSAGLLPQTIMNTKERMISTVSYHDGALTILMVSSPIFSLTPVSILSMGANVFQRTYVGIDKRGRFGIFWDYILGYTRSKTQFSASDGAYSLKEKGLLSFAPGVVYFPMNNLSIQACISLAELSYNKVTAYESGLVSGTRTAWKAQASLNVLNLNFGLTIHL